MGRFLADVVGLTGAKSVQQDHQVFQFVFRDLEKNSRKTMVVDRDWRDSDDELLMPIHTMHRLLSPLCHWNLEPSSVQKRRRMPSNVFPARPVPLIAMPGSSGRGFGQGSRRRLPPCTKSTELLPCRNTVP